MLSIENIVFTKLCYIAITHIYSVKDDFISTEFTSKHGKNIVYFKTWFKIEQNLLNSFCSYDLAKNTFIGFWVNV